jgi:hypothetical protein
MCARGHAANGDWAAAAQSWEQAAALGHVPSYAALAEIYYEGREGVARWFERAAELSSKGAGTGCGDCKVFEFAITKSQFWPRVKSSALRACATVSQ